MASDLGVVPHNLHMDLYFVKISPELTARSRRIIDVLNSYANKERGFASMKRLTNDEDVLIGSGLWPDYGQVERCKSPIYFVGSGGIVF